MLDVRCYKVTSGIFNGNVIEQWVQIFINENYEDEYDEEADLCFNDMKTEVEGIPVFSTSEDVDDIQQELKIAVKKYGPQLILLTEYELFQQIIEASIEDEILSVEIAFTRKKSMLHYAEINCDALQHILLVAM